VKTKPRAWRIRDYEHLLDLLDQAITDRDTNITAVAARIGIPRDTLSRNLGGVSRMSVPTAIAAAQALGLDFALIPQERR
jgi:DNA-binding phage protein